MILNIENTIKIIGNSTKLSQNKTFPLKISNPVFAPTILIEMMNSKSNTVEKNHQANINLIVFNKWWTIFNNKCY